MIVEAEGTMTDNVNDKDCRRQTQKNIANYIKVINVFHTCVMLLLASISVQVMFVVETNRVGQRFRKLVPKILYM